MRKEAENTVKRLNVLDETIGPMRPLSDLPRDWRVNPHAQVPLPDWAKGEAVPLASDAIVPAPEKEEEIETERKMPPPTPADTTNNTSTKKRKERKKFSDKRGGIGAALSLFRGNGDL